MESGLAVTPRGEVTLGQARKLVQSNAVSVNGEKAVMKSLQLTRAEALYRALLYRSEGQEKSSHDCDDLML